MKRWVIPITLALEIGHVSCARPAHYPFKAKRTQAPVDYEAPFTSRFTAKRSLLGSQQKAYGAWNPEPAFLQWVEQLDMEEVKKHLHSLHGDKSKANHNSTFRQKVDRTLAHDKSLTNATWPGITADDWNLGKHHWPSFFFNLAPGPVVDLCGGTLKVTKYSEISEKCSMWVIQMMRCTQTCSRSNRFGGYGHCMWGCSGIPDPKWCEEPTDEKIRKHCQVFMGRWDTCKVSKEPWPDADSWFAAIDSCVFPCSSVMETEKMMGQPVSWRYVKCNPVWYACGTRTDPFMCSTIDPFLCQGPVGQGGEVCFNDDPWCGDPNWGCYPQPDPKAETVTHVLPSKNPGIEPDTTVVSIYNETGGFVMNATMPRLAYIKPAAPPQWYTIVRPTPFAPKPTKAPTTTPPPCQVNVTHNGTFLGFVNGTFNGTDCNFNQSHAADLINSSYPAAGGAFLEEGTATTRAPLTTMSPDATTPPPAASNHGQLKVGTQALSLTERMHGMLARIKTHPWPMFNAQED